MICKTENRKDIIHSEKEGEKGTRWDETATTKTIQLI